MHCFSPSRLRRFRIGAPRPQRHCIQSIMVLKMLSPQVRSVQIRSSMKNIFRNFLMIAVAATAAAGQSKTPAPSEVTPAQPAPRKVDRAAAYYHYAVAHMYEEQVTVYGRSELANKAMEEYRLAIEADPSSEFLTSGLAELYVKTGRIRDAVLQAQDILKRDPNNLEAHKLLGRIYLRSLGDDQGGSSANSSSGSENVLKLAIEQ